MTLQQLNLGICHEPTATVQDFLAKVSVLLASEEVSKIHGALSSLKSCGWRKYKDLNIFSLRTSRDCFHTMEKELSAQSSRLFMNWGTMQNGRCLTAKISESRKTGKGCSLSDILEESVDEKYFLSPEKQKTLVLELAE